MSTKAQRKTAARASIAALALPLVGVDIQEEFKSYGDRERGVLELTDGDLPDVGTDIQDSGGPLFRWQQASLLAAIAANPAIEVDAAMVADIAGCLNALPTKAEMKSHWPKLQCPDGRSYADAYEEIELPAILVQATVIIGASGLTEMMQPLVEALCGCCARHKLPSSTRQHIGSCIDCWCQATGIDVDNPTGCWEIVTGAAEKGWKNPRKARPERGKKVQ